MDPTQIKYLRLFAFSGIPAGLLYGYFSSNSAFIYNSTIIFSLLWGAIFGTANTLLVSIYTKFIRFGCLSFGILAFSSFILGGVLGFFLLVIGTETLSWRWVQLNTPPERPLAVYGYQLDQMAPPRYVIEVSGKRYYEYMWGAPGEWLPFEGFPGIPVLREGYYCGTPPPARWHPRYPGEVIAKSIMNACSFAPQTQTQMILLKDGSVWRWNAWRDGKLILIVSFLWSAPALIGTSSTLIRKELYWKVRTTETNST